VKVTEANLATVTLGERILAPGPDKTWVASGVAFDQDQLDPALSRGPVFRSTSRRAPATAPGTSFAPRRLQAFLSPALRRATRRRRLTGRIENPDPANGGVLRVRNQREALELAHGKGTLAFEVVQDPPAEVWALGATPRAGWQGCRPW
jgi:hypothetical protein